MGIRASELEQEMKSSSDAIEAVFNTQGEEKMGGCNREFADRRAASGG